MIFRESSWNPEFSSTAKVCAIQLMPVVRFLNLYGRTIGIAGLGVGLGGLSDVDAPSSWRSVVCPFGMFVGSSEFEIARSWADRTCLTKHLGCLKM